MRGTPQRVRRDRVGKEHEIYDDKQLQAPVRMIESNADKHQHIAKGRSLRSGLDACEGVGHAQHAQPGRKQKYRAKQDQEASSQLRHVSLRRITSSTNRIEKDKRRK